MHNKDIKISVVTPSFNQSNFLENTILSVVNQNFKNIEYIVIDGGSTDGSLEIIKKYDKYIHYWISEKDNGQTDAINKGFKVATGDIICFLNSDDFFIKDSLENVANHFKKNLATDILLCDGIYCNSNGELEKYYRYISPIKILSKHGIIAFCQQSMFIKKSSYFKIGGLSNNLHYCMDSDFIYKAIDFGCKFSVLHKPAGVFRWHDKMKSTDMSLTKIEEERNLSIKYHYKRRFRLLAKIIYMIIQTLNLNYLINFIKTNLLKKKQLQIYQNEK